MRRRAAEGRGIRVTMLIAAAAAAALIPMPAEKVEGLYSERFYPAIQGPLTMITNLVPVALFDVAAVALLLLLVALFVRRVRRLGALRGIVRTVTILVGIAAVAYLLFLALWGLNYRRVPLEQKLDYDRSRVTHDNLVAFASRAVAAINGGYEAAHATPVNLTSLEQAFVDAQRALRARRYATPGTPKRSILSWYFRRAGVDGMTDPFFLEIIVNPDVLDIERPMVVAHEWGHLAGYANESEASFIAWLTCVRGDRLAQYSGWLAAYEHAMRALPRQDRPAVQPLATGPREDLRAITARYERTSPVVRKAAETVYDEYLRANRVPEGIGSYDAVLRLMVGTRFEADWTPVVR
jgi:hypothetical protein